MEKLCAEKYDTNGLRIINIKFVTVLYYPMCKISIFRDIFSNNKASKSPAYIDKKKFFLVFSAVSYMFLPNTLLYNTLANV